MKNNVLPNYETGAAQRIMINYDDIVYPDYQFIDKYTEINWARTYSKKIDKITLKKYIVHKASAESLYKRHERRKNIKINDFVALSFIDKIKTLELSPSNYKYDRAIGIEIECYGSYLKEKLPIWAREKQDGSLDNGGVEFALLLKRSELEMRLHKFCSLLYNHKVNKRCGLHIHLDQRNKTEKEVIKLAKHLDKWLSALKEFLPLSRRENNYCKFGVSRFNGSRYRAVNVCSFAKYKTLEIRVHSGTTDYTKIISWIRLLELLSVINFKPKGEGITALAQLPLSEYEKSYWLKRHQELNFSQYNSTTPASELE
jgi:hypothetical protein